MGNLLPKVASKAVGPKTEPKEQISVAKMSLNLVYKLLYKLFSAIMQFLNVYVSFNFLILHYDIQNVDGLVHCKLAFFHLPIKMILFVTEKIN